MIINSSVSGTIIVRQAQTAGGLSYREVAPFKEECVYDLSEHSFNVHRKDDNGININYGNEPHGMVHLNLPQGLNVDTIRLSGQAKVLLELPCDYVNISSSGQGSVVFVKKVNHIQSALSGQSTLMVANGTAIVGNISGQSWITAVHTQFIEANISGQSSLSVIGDAKRVYLSLSGQSNAVITGDVELISGTINSGCTLMHKGKATNHTDLKGTGYINLE
ncbi:hypothetical protein PAECIP112173_01370 [Paenibacillus sp. JJ-100]|uniref:hypothetical protein n=1 Tax=Paenibacillus sp. JJ-100 TaxID=2974896 RepID=UPI0022FF6F84|nr:hypothetical protein [Paenibacillus sp. JJ-100]CAI6050530.1 hypothetical protein PAECIP112173_01370 [Paenibacillus sp. JJ-100]